MANGTHLGKSHFKPVIVIEGIKDDFICEFPAKSTEEQTELEIINDFKVTVELETTTFHYKKVFDNIGDVEKCFAEIIKGDQPQR